MGARIEAFGFTRPRRPGLRPSSVRLAVRAGREALKSAGRSPDEIDLLLNCGVYADEGVAEPANAAFIQRRLRIHAGPSSFADGAAFSFDVNAGGCGVLSGAQTADALLASGASRRALVVTSDVQPMPVDGHGFPFAPSGGALVLGPGGPGEGFTAFRSETWREDEDLLTAGWAWTAGRGPGLRRLYWGGGFRAHVVEKPDYAVRCAERAAGAVAEWLETLEIAPSEIDLVIPSQHPAGFPALLAARTELATERIVSGKGTPRRVCHTAGPIQALELARRDGRLAGARQVLFVCVSAGLTVTLALYQGRCGPEA